MRRVRKQASAEHDLIDIWVYSYEQWGEDQAEKYVRDLEAAIEQISRNSELGQRCDHIREGYRALRVNRHILYYKVTPRGIQIVRVLHERMDPERHV
jgi:toxin ParE1/3/4